MKNVLALLCLLSLALPARAQELRLAGQRSEIKEARMAVARTKAEFEALWKQHDAAAAAPAVDFSKQIVVAVFLGEKRTAGTRVELTLMPDPMDAKKLVVFWKEIAPERASFTAEVKTAPFEMRAVPNTYAAVSFERNVRARAMIETLQGLVEKGGFDPR